jgi:conjugal transfer pilus assembly protein TraB
LRILDDGHLPQGVLAKVKNGLILASAYGDISTERVYMRLERLTKVQPNGEFVETEITGFVSGEDGKYGVRGQVVDKSACLVANAAYSGFFSGVSQFLNTTMVASLSNSSCGCGGNPFGWELLEGSGLQGTTNAFDMLADYYIQRAEQIVPVIEVTAGRVVDITFTHKAELGDLCTQDKVRQIRTRCRKDASKRGGGAVNG